MPGTLANGDLIQSTWETIYTLPDAEGAYAVVKIFVMNRSDQDATIRLAVGPASSPPANSDYLEYDLVLPPKSSLERSGVVIGPNDSVMSYTTAPDCSLNVNGIDVNIPEQE